MPTIDTSTAVQRETDWLSQAGDGLPALLAGAGGPFDEVHAYFPTVPSMESRTLYVLRSKISQPRFAAQRLMSTYPFRLVAWWPLLSVDGAEADQQALDDAVELVLQRIAGFPTNKTHGGRFLSVAENPRIVEGDFTQVEDTIPSGYISAVITYSADDPEISN